MLPDHATLVVGRQAEAEPDADREEETTPQEPVEAPAAEDEDDRRQRQRQRGRIPFRRMAERPSRLAQDAPLGRRRPECGR